MSNWLFTSNIFQLGESNPFADWLKPSLHRLGFQVPHFAPGTCGWRLELPFGFSLLVVTCRVSPASAVSNADGLGLKSKDLWQLFTQAQGPTAQGSLLKKMFSKPDPMQVALRDMKLVGVNQHLNPDFEVSARHMAG